MGYRAGLPARTSVEILPGEGHFIVDHRPEVVAQRAADFFRA
jgi:pimeloyl-ACP methyl ester carboxylesterase